MGKIIDMTGWKMSEHGMENSFITVLHKDFDFEQSRKSGQPIRWICQCERCGTIKSIAGIELRRSKKPTLSCGCLLEERNKNFGAITFRDLSNECFGLLTAKRKIGTNKYGYSIWECVCDCGKKVEVSSRELLSGDTKSCGCEKYSIGEAIIKKFLEAKKIPFKKEYFFEDLKSLSGKNLRFDFAIFDETSQLKFLIEFQGIQHFSAIEFFGGEEGYKKLKQHDDLKKKYCYDNNITLYTISYNENIEEELEKILEGDYHRS